MKHIWQLAVREITERKLIFVVALAVGLVAPLLGTFREMDVLVVALVLGVGLGHGVALLVGATTVNRPLREGRLGFFFNRPVGEGSLWWGKLLGAFLLSAGVQVLAFVPAWLWATARGADLSDASSILAASVAGLLGSVLVGHVFGTMIGARSKASLADLAALVVSASLLWFGWARLSELFAFTAQVVLLSLVGVAGLAGALIGGWRQVKLGRVDGGRSHRALSLSVWTATLTAALLGFGFSSWVRDVDPSEMAMLVASSGSESPWFVTQQTYAGEDVRHGIATQFLVHAETGEWETLALGRAGRLRAQVSADGRRVVWSQRSDGCVAEGWAADAADGAPSSRRRLQRDVCDVTTWKLSRSGDAVADVAFIDQQSRPDEMNVRFRVWDLQTGRSMMEEWLSVRKLRDRWTPASTLFWDEDGTLRLFVEDGWDLHLWRFDPESEATTKLATLKVGEGDRSLARFYNNWHDPFGGWYYGGAAELRFDRGGQRVLVAAVTDSFAEPIERPPLFEEENSGQEGGELDPEPTEVDPDEVELRDGTVSVFSLTVWDGELNTAEYSLPATLGLRGSMLLLSDHVVALGRDDERRLLLRVGGAGGWLHEYPWHWPVGALGDSHLDVVGREGKRFVLDLDNGELEPFGAELEDRMKGRSFMLSQSDLSGNFLGGSDGVETSLRALYAHWGYKGEGDSVVRFDVATGEVTPFFHARR